MKKLFLFTAALATISSLSQAQAIDNRMDSLKRAPGDYELGLEYLKRNRQQKTIAWIMLAGGIGLYAAGASQWDLYSQTTGADAMIVAGTLATLGSIPLFIIAAKNKGRANILLRRQNIPLTHAPGTQLTSVGVAIKLGK